MRKWMIVLTAVCGAAVSHAAAQTPVAVFNFQMKSDTPDWLWLEKGLADQITTDMVMNGKLTVLARDEMQTVASTIHWQVEDKGPDEGRLQEIQKQTKIQYLVTGVYSVQDGNIGITAMIVDVDSRKELARRQVAGAAGDVLQVEKRLASEVLSWFLEAPVQELLPQLQLWSRSVPAVRALYEGMDLYDQGRYGEAWLRFRQSARDDPEYLEATYWVGRMYYFMNRYEHARRCFERLMYMAPDHPLVGNAIKEYVHTYESLDAGPGELLLLYQNLSERFPKVRIYNEMGDAGWVSNRCWLWCRSAIVQGKLGRLVEAAELAAQAEDLLRAPFDATAYRVAMGNAQDYNMLTGEVCFPKGLRQHYGQCMPIVFTLDGLEQTSLLHSPAGPRPEPMPDGRVHYRSVFEWWFLVAPDGYVFKSLHFFPILDGNEGMVVLNLHKDNFGDVPGGRWDKTAVLRPGGVKFDEIPRAGLLHVHCGIGTETPGAPISTHILGMRAVAELEKVGPHGAISVSCQSTQDFIVDVDGRMGRKRTGLIGLVPPGEHTLRFRPGNGQALGEWTTTVQVEANSVLSVAARLPWRPESKWASWQPATLIGRDYPGPGVCLQRMAYFPTIQADDQAIRLVWTWDGDLWSSISTDGNTFTLPAKLPMPISSGWMEDSPQCFRDESGRFILLFRSDRNAQRQLRVYLSWSRDFVHWSGPAMVADRPVSAYHVALDTQGRLLWADVAGKMVTILASSDAFHWESLQHIALDNPGTAIQVLQREDGLYQLFVLANPPLEGIQRLLCYASNDGRQWSPGPQVARISPQGGYFPEAFLSAVAVKGRPLVAVSQWVQYLQLFRESSPDAWQQSPVHYGAVGSQSVMGYHPRWGYILSWVASPEYQFPEKTVGPFLIRGLSVDGLFQALAAKPRQPASATTSATKP